MNRTIWIGIIGGVLLLLALLLNWLSNPEPMPEPVESAPQSQTEEAAPPAGAGTADAVQSEPAPSQTGDSQPASSGSTAQTDSSAQPEAPAAPGPSTGTGEGTQSAATDAQQQPAAPTLTPPTFDVVRIDPNGDAVIAGRADPGATVTVLDGGADLGSVEADDRGEWVYLPSSPLPPGPHELKLRADMPDGSSILGKGTVVLVVPKPGHDVAGRETQSETPQQPLVVLIPDETPGAELIQAPPADGVPAGETTTSDAAPSKAPAPGSTTAEPSGVKSADGALSVETIDYDPSGNISIAGKGPKSSLVIAYLNNSPIGSGPVEENGTWRINPEKEVAPGVYSMRLDAVRDSGVVARLEIPFSRAAPLTDLSGDAFIVVQPGNSLWRIARRTLGEGLAYTVIYDANSDQIRDPDLIYPGQVFEIPKQ